MNVTDLVEFIWQSLTALTAVLNCLNCLVMLLDQTSPIIIVSREKEFIDTIKLNYP